MASVKNDGSSRFGDPAAVREVTKMQVQVSTSLVAEGSSARRGRHTEDGKTASLAVLAALADHHDLDVVQLDNSDFFRLESVEEACARLASMPDVVAEVRAAVAEGKVAIVELPFEIVSGVSRVEAVRRVTLTHLGVN